MSVQYDDGRGLTGARRDAYLRATVGRFISIRHPEPAKLSLTTVTLGSKAEAYALAIRIMQEADRLWRASA